MEKFTKVSVENITFLNTYNVLQHKTEQPVRTYILLREY